MSADTIQIRFDKSHLVTLGEKLYGESLELLRELVSNAYDADARHVWIEVTPERISVRDDGWGMDEEGLREFFTIGSQNKKLSPVSPRFGRTRIGQFGIGKFAVLTACERFRVRTQRSDFAAEVVFDKRSWNIDEEWHVPLTRRELDEAESDGTTVILEELNRIFALPDIERFLRERMPLNDPNFTILLNDRRIEATVIPGRKFAIEASTAFGPIRGELILPLHAPRKPENAGIECVVRGVVICRSTFGFDLPVLSRLRGRIAADFLPITSDRSRFISDSPEYRVFLAVLSKELHHISRQIKDLAERREKQKADETLKDTLVRMRRAIKRNPDIAPPMLSATGEVDESGEGVASDVIQMQMEGMPPVETQNSPDTSEVKEPLPKKVRVRNLQGKTIVARKMMIGGTGITCALDGFGRGSPAAFTEGGIVYINIDHPLYRKQAERGQEMLGFYLTYLLSQQVSLLLSSGDIRRAFEMQNRLLTDSW
ncbi:ATP-binding protein [Candidatus Peregrinibacteria bacterium]|nr:ATP-binding protein [Candidatus Peregrinibacteria bacterium]MBI3816576.1 ATP-binding protein [Candidatus Peregrinibacteria bacterium]